MLGGRPRVAEERRRRLIRKLRRQIRNADVPSESAWLLLADLYHSRAARLAALHRALKLCPHNAEAHAELADLHAESGAKRTVRTHCEAAIRYSGESDIADNVLYTVCEAASRSNLPDIAARARSLGRRRFPKCGLFQD